MKNSEKGLPKIWSLNPKKYKWISSKEASRGYKAYLKSIRASEKYLAIKDGKPVKSLGEWLETEI